MGSSAEALSGRVAVVTGASRGIGQAVAERLAGAGVRVAMVARGVSALEAAARGIGGIAIALDVSDRAGVAMLPDRLEAAAGVRIPDILVNAAGMFDLGPIAGTDPAVFDAHIDTNLRGPFLMIRALLPGMLERGSGDIITIGSIAGRIALPGNGAYGASKFGVRGLHAVLDLELKGTGVRSTLIEPAATDTPLWDAIDRTRHEGLPGPGMMIEPTDVADAVIWVVQRPGHAAIRNLSLERA